MRGMMTGFQGRTAVVTGAASGNGLAIAERLHDEGAAVVCVDVDGDSLKRSVSQGQGIVHFVGDVTKPDDARGACELAAETFGGLDILVNNAGIVRFGTFLDLSLDEWDTVFAVNVTGAFLFTQAAARVMIAHPGSREGTTRSIVNITSAEAHVVVSSSGHPQVHYNASKGALHMLTRATAIELASHGIRVNEVAPGVIETPLTKEALDTAKGQEFWMQRTPIGRIGRPADIASAVAYLSSEEASYVTGSTLFVDGGYTVL
jgi:NAD(P)-dependent dehydrogenase (short-subunit alcohol dehydrogenase family)